MLKRIIISNKEYNMKSSALTIAKYKNLYGRDMLKDILQLSKRLEKTQKENKLGQEDIMVEEFVKILELAQKLAYIMILEANKDFIDFESWLGEIDDYMVNKEWVKEVLELAMSPFRGGIQLSS